MESIKYGKIVVEIQQKGMIHMATKNRLVIWRHYSCEYGF